MPYPLPPWLTPRTDPAAEYGQSLRQATALAGQMQMEQARLAASAQQAEQELAARRAEAEERHAREQQELQMTKAFHDSQLGLKQQELQQAQQELQLKTQLAARKMQAQAAFEAEVGDASDPERVVRAMQKYGTAMGEPGSAMAAAMRAAQAKAAFVPGPVQGQPVIDPLTGKPMKGAVATPSPTGKGMQVHYFPTERTFGEKEKAQLRQWNTEAKDILAKYPLGIERAKPKTPEQAAAVEKDKATLQRLRDNAEQLLAPEQTQAALPAGAAAPTTATATGAPRVRVVSMSRGGQEIPIVRGTSPPHEEPGMTEAGAPAPEPYVAKDKFNRPLPTLNFQKFVDAIKTDPVRGRGAVEELGQMIADKIGPTGTYIGSTPFRHKTGSVFSDVLLKGRSAKLPALTEKQLVDWINSLEPADRTQLLYDALDKGDFGTGDLAKLWGYPAKPAKAAAAPAPQERVAAGYE